MSWEQLLPPDRVKWEVYGCDYYPVWPSEEPDVAVIKEIVASTLPQEEDDFTVEYLAEGAHHKVYEVSHPAWSKTYIFRIALAVDPRLKVESEMATLLFLKQNTSIPAPKPIAFSSSVHEKLGYEWALLEKLPGVGLDDVWDQVPWEKKEEIIDTLAGFLVQLWAPNLRFSSIGSLYLPNAESSSHHTDKISPEESVDPLKNIDSQEECPPKATVSGTPSNTTEETVSEELIELPADIGPEEADSPIKSSRQETVIAELDSTTKEADSNNSDHPAKGLVPEEPFHSDQKTDDETGCDESDHPSKDTGYQSSGHDGFTIGPSTDASFFSQHRLYLDVNRGPYKSCHDWVAAIVQVEEQFIGASKALWESRQEMTARQKAEDWSTLVEELGMDERESLDDYENRIATCLRYQRALPLVFPKEGTPRDDMLPFVLGHTDLDDRNILVDPETFTITGILDWEQTCIVPDWYGIGYPLLINTSSPVGDGEPPVPKTYDEDSPDYNPVQVSERHRWDGQLLRARFDQTVEKLLGSKEWRPTTSDDDPKLWFIRGARELFDFWQRARNTLKSIEEDLKLPQLPESGDPSMFHRQLVEGHLSTGNLQPHDIRHEAILVQGADEPNLCPERAQNTERIFEDLKASESAKSQSDHSED